MSIAICQQATLSSFRFTLSTLSLNNIGDRMTTTIWRWRATIAVLAINASERVEIREALMAEGVFPPSLREGD